MLIENYFIQIRKTVEHKNGRQSDLVGEINICAENVNVNDIMYTLLQFDRLAREKNKEADNNE